MIATCTAVCSDATLGFQLGRPRACRSGRGHAIRYSSQRLLDLLARRCCWASERTEGVGPSVNLCFSATALTHHSECSQPGVSWCWLHAHTSNFYTSLRQGCLCVCPCLHAAGRHTARVQSSIPQKVKRNESNTFQIGYFPFNVLP